MILDSRINLQMTFERFFPGEVTTTNFTTERVEHAASIICDERLRLVRGLESFISARKKITVKYEEVYELILITVTKFIQNKSRCSSVKM